MVDVTAAGAGEFWIFTGILALASLACLGFSFHFLRKARLLEDTPTSRIRSAAQGYVELDGIGRLMDGPEITGALTGLPCLWWEYTIERKVTTGHGKHRTTHWQTIAGECSECLFLLADDTGTCVVDPDGATVIAGERDRWYGGSPRWSGPPPEPGWRRWFSSRRYRYTERRLVRTRPLYAIGWFRTEGGAGSDFNTADEVRETLAGWKRDPQAMARFDMDGDGEVDLVEWEDARRAAEDEVREAQLARALQPGVHVLGRPPPHVDRPFLLSALPQATLTRRFRWAAFALLVGFFLCGGSVASLMTARIAAGM